jgi:DNA-binding SARP family transcriptional activator/streptogramin lyase
MASGLQPKVFLAGRVAVETDGVVIDEGRFPGRQGRLLFAYLVAEQGRPVPRDELAEALWGETPPPTWDKALTGLVSKLRSLLTVQGIDGATALTGAFGCYRLELPEGSWVDVVAAAHAVHEAETALAAGDLENARNTATLAVSLLRQPFLPGEDAAWVEEKRRELSDGRERALDALADACLRSGDAAEAVRWAEQTIALAPFRETGYRRLMEAHAAAGNRAEALRVYERCRRLLAEELGAYPSPETESIYRSLLERCARDGSETAMSMLEAREGVDSSPRANGGSPKRSRRRSVALVGTVLVVSGVAAAMLALTGRGAPPPTVSPNSLVRIDAKTLKVTAVVPVGDAPDLVVAAGGYVWLTHYILRDFPSGALRNAGDRTLTRVDPRTGEAVVVGGGLAPCGLTADPSGDVWVANCFPATTGSRDSVVRIGARTLAFKHTWRVPGGEGFYRGLAYGGGSLWVAGIWGDTPSNYVLTQLDPQTGKARAIDLPRPAAGLEWSESYGDLWTENFADGTLTRLHAATGTLATVADAAFNPGLGVVDGDVVWVSDWSAPSVTRIRAVGPARPRSVGLPGDFFGNVWDVAAGAGAVWATTPRAGALWRIDPRTNAVTRVPIPYLPTGVAADSDNVWVTVRAR